MGREVEFGNTESPVQQNFLEQRSASLMYSSSDGENLVEDFGPLMEVGGRSDEISQILCKKFCLEWGPVGDVEAE